MSIEDASARLDKRPQFQPVSSSFLNC